MPRALWKGAISFGVVHVPVALYPAARESRINELLKRSLKGRTTGRAPARKATGGKVASSKAVIKQRATR